MTVQITTEAGDTYKADLFGDRIEIYRVKPGINIWSGQGRWTGARIVDVAADIGDEAYDLLDEALAEAVYDAAR